MTARRRAGPRWLVPILAALAVAAVGTGCADPSPTPSPTSPSPTPPSPEPSLRPSLAASPSAARLHGLLLLAGRPGAMGLELIGERGERRPVR
ncbi:MAG: hypothetical protein ACXWWR_04075, partial [Candidatus Limnocylindrales bacterium]